MNSDALKTITASLGKKLGVSVSVGPDDLAGDPWLSVDATALSDVAVFLRDEVGFNYLNSVTAVDYCAVGKKKIAGEPRIEVVYHLSNLSSRDKLTLKVTLPRWVNDKEGQLPVCPSVSNVWSTADWHEREVYDLHGIEFTGHPNLVRILCPEDWVGHPLRKDYEMPLEYHGIRGR